MKAGSHPCHHTRSSQTDHQRLITPPDERSRPGDEFSGFRLSVSARTAHPISSDVDGAALSRIAARKEHHEDVASAIQTSDAARVHHARGPRASEQPSWLAELWTRRVQHSVTLGPSPICFSICMPPRPTNSPWRCSPHHHGSLKPAPSVDSSPNRVHIPTNMPFGRRLLARLGRLPS